MKRLMLLRHAKSLRDESKKDKDRPLNDRGRADAPRMGSYMHHMHYAPDLVLCSSSRRTRETWALVAAELDGAPGVRFEDALYLASSKAIQKIVAAADAAACLLVIGHNPGTEECARVLAREPHDKRERKLLAELGEKFPTGALAVFEFDVSSWKEIEAGKGALIDFVVPKGLNDD